MKIIREIIREVGTIKDYKGICDGCGTPLEYEGELIVVVVARMDDRHVFCPVDNLVCPHCNREIVTVNVYKSMDVTQEIEGLSK